MFLPDVTGCGPGHNVACSAVAQPRLGSFVIYFVRESGAGKQGWNPV